MCIDCRTRTGRNLVHFDLAAGTMPLLCSNEPLSACIERTGGTNAVRVVGVDGCPGGWLAMAFDGDSLEPRFHPTFSELVLSYPAVGCIAVDIPIGLSAGAPRACDLAARRILGRRGSSVFPAPDPRLLEFATHSEASAQSRELIGKGLSIQSFGIFPKVAEVN